MYKALNIDTDKALEALNEARKIKERAHDLRIAKAVSYMDGVREGLSVAESIFYCSNYEKPVQPKESTYVEGVIDFIYEIGKELDVPTQDLRENLTSVDEVAHQLASRIKERFLEMGGTT